MSILENIKSRADLLAVPQEKLGELCGEIRAFLIGSLSRTGGHLASNLGAVELSVALDRVYDPWKDRIVFDVGHQCYTHKLLTGRMAGFDKLRHSGGVSGFPKPGESGADAFIAGHASNSVAVALGMARARTLMGADYDVAAVIGDGALTGGLAYEGLSSAGQSGEPMVVILNDNAMSIRTNVGGMARLLSRLRVRPAYFDFKRRYRQTVGRIKPVYNAIHAVKEQVKGAILHSNVFDDMGFYYLGPVDGHDVNGLISALSWAREMRVPVLLHVITRKGRGYPAAELHPDMYHGVGPYDPLTGELKKSGESFSGVFGRELTRLAAADGRIAAITAAMADGTGLTTFEKRFPERFFDAGIAEGGAVAMAAGMAKQGMLPVAAIYSTFLQRAYDQLIHDVSLLGLHVVFGVDRAGLVGEDGETHHGVFDVAYLSSVPGMTVYAPASFAELRDMLHRALYETDGPAAVRYPRGGEGGIRLRRGAGPARFRLRRRRGHSLLRHHGQRGPGRPAAAEGAGRGREGREARQGQPAPGRGALRGAGRWARSRGRGGLRRRRRGREAGRRGGSARAGPARQAAQPGLRHSGPGHGGRAQGRLRHRRRGDSKSGKGAGGR